MDDVAFLQRMLDVEAALARASASVGAVPADAAEAIARSCRVEHLDVPRLLAHARTAGTPVVPLVRALTDLVPAESRAWVHRGATSQDVIDTALVLHVRDTLDRLDGSLRTWGDACAELAEAHRGTLMPGRTLLQHAAPITFGLKAARWLGLVTRQLQRLGELRPRVLVVQLGGAVGTLAAFGDRGLDVVAALADELDLGVPDLPWHAERDRVAELAAVLGVLAGSAAKVAGDVVLLASSDVAEVAEAGAPGKGVSSAMPQKRNPVDAVAALAAARLATGHVATVLSAAGAHEHERAAGAWQAEWTALPAVCAHTVDAVEAATAAVVGLRVDAERMGADLDASRGLVMAEALAVALTPRLGRGQAQQVLAEAVDRVRRSGARLGDVVAHDERVAAVLTPAELDEVLDPRRALGAADALVTRALDGWAAVVGRAAPGGRPA